jgi:ADP-ribose pyrophosphatase YjhB (NUDIX family)
MRTTLYFTDRILLLTDEAESQLSEGDVLLSEIDLSRAKIVKIFETTNRIVVRCHSVEEAFERFSAEFKIVEAAGGVVSLPSGEVLMIYRRGRWDLPKGHIDWDESAEECAVREIAEETGVAGAKIVRFLCNTMHAYGVYGVWELKQTSWYLCSAESCPTKPQQEEDIATAKWCSKEEVEENLRHSYPTIRNVFATRKAVK